MRGRLTGSLLGVGLFLVPVAVVHGWHHRTQVVAVPVAAAPVAGVSAYTPAATYAPSMQYMPTMQYTPTMQYAAVPYSMASPYGYGYGAGCWGSQANPYGAGAGCYGSQAAPPPCGGSPSQAKPPDRSKDSSRARALEKKLDQMIAAVRSSGPAGDRVQVRADSEAAPESTDAATEEIVARIQEWRDRRRDTVSTRVRTWHRVRTRPTVVKSP